MTLQFSFSLLSADETCPEQARQIYVLKAYKKSFAKLEGGIDEHRVLERRLRFKEPLPPQLSKAEQFVASFEQHGTPLVEVSLGIDRHNRPVSFWDAWLRGKYDVVVKYPEQRRAVLGDWKTGKVRESSDQLEIGAMLLMHTDPEIDTVVGVNIWLVTPELGRPYTFTREHLTMYDIKWFRRIVEIEKRDADKEWEKRQSMLCQWCPVKVCQFYRGG